MGFLPRTRLGLVSLAMAGGLLTGACGGTAGSEPDERPGEGERVVGLEGLTFDPETLTVPVGTTVTWTNEDAVEHTVTSGAKGEQGVPGVSKGTADRPDGAFDEALEERDASYSFTFDEPGTYEYFCRIHGGMTGVVVVE